jgi:two-component system cell cycle response regulator
MRSGSLPITISVGIASFESPSDTLEDLLKRADLALYRAKREGRNRVIDNAA